MKTVQFYVGELAEAYGLKTLYDYVKTVAMNADIFFYNGCSRSRSTEILAGCEQKFLATNIDLEVCGFADISHYSNDASRTLRVDLAILKNCAVPLTAEQKSQLRKKYGIDNARPVLVVGFADSSCELASVVEELCKEANIYLVGNQYDLPLNWHKIYGNFHTVTTHGVLKDYYAIADLAITACDLQKRTSHLHNFVEATEGGPLFLVKPGNTAQYGYKELKQAGAIQECDSLDELIKRASAFVRDFNGNEDHVVKRTTHIQETRKKYLPAIVAHMHWLLGRKIRIPKSDLRLKDQRINQLLCHPDTKW